MSLKSTNVRRTPDENTRKVMGNGDYWQSTPDLNRSSGRRIGKWALGLLAAVVVMYLLNHC